MKETRHQVSVDKLQTISENSGDTRILVPGGPDFFR